MTNNIDIEEIIEIIISTGAVPYNDYRVFNEHEIMDIEKKAQSSNDEKLEKYIRKILKKKG